MPLQVVDARPVKPSLATMKLNVDAVLYSASDFQ